jgi:neutral ceramidase
LQTGVVHDEKPARKEFGSIHRDADSSYAPGEVVSVTFWGGHPKNDLKIQSSFLEVQRKVGETWEVVAHDWDPETRYIWKREGLAHSLTTIQWMIPQEAPAGIHRIRHDGHWKSGWLNIVRPYSGISREFAVRPREVANKLAGSK